jgi:hypothetical protein
MSTASAVTLQLGELTLQLSPFVSTDEDRRRSVEIVKITSLTEETKPTMGKVIDDFFAIAPFVMDLLLKSAAQNHPDLTRGRIEENLDHRNLPLALAALVRMSEITLTRMLETLEIRSQIN